MWTASDFGTHAASVIVGAIIAYFLPIRNFFFSKLIEKDRNYWTLLFDVYSGISKCGAQRPGPSSNGLVLDDYLNKARALKPPLCNIAEKCFMNSIGVRDTDKLAELDRELQSAIKGQF